MQLVGMLDSPYVRRAAISLSLLGLEFTSRPVSVFSTLDAFRAINPVAKAPTLVAPDGTVLMDSNLIIDYAEAVAGPARSLWPADLPGRLQALRITGLALAACEKAVQIVYEHAVRPPEKRHAPWMERVEAQLQAAWTGLEQELDRAAPPAPAGGQPVGQAGLTAAVTWSFARLMVPTHADPARYPALSAYAAQAEALPVFTAWPMV